MKTIITKMSMISLIVLMMASCKKDPEMPGEFVNIKTNEVTEITGFSAAVSAYVGADCDERGVCWGKSANPTVSGSHKASGSGTGSFTSNITGLTDNTTYYVRAYATDSKGTSYGEHKSFTTQSVSVPTITTSSVSNITLTTATCGGNVTSDGGATVTARGVCWSTSQDPTVSNSHTTDGSDTGSFTSNITGLTDNTTYYVRAYATNSKGTSYGEQKSFTTKDGLPTIVTGIVSNIRATSAKCSGEVTDDGGFPVMARGVCWSTSQNPTVSYPHTTDGSGTGSFTSNITGLTENTTYYVRAYATNSKGTSYGEQKSFIVNYVNGHEYVDLGLPSGLLWATCNVGANQPDDCGNYYAWGETTPKSIYDWNTYKWCNYSDGTFTKYNTKSNYGTVDNKTVLDPEDDAAHVNWGGDWRMPTSTSWQELYNYTTHQWTTENGVKGYKFTSKTNSNKYIFLPASGYCRDTGVYNAGSDGCYWSSSLYSSDPYFAYRMYFLSGSVYPHDYNYRYEGHSVRPVCAAR